MFINIYFETRAEEFDSQYYRKEKFIYMPRWHRNSLSVSFKLIFIEFTFNTHCNRKTKL